jgi:hypothetical protein
MVTVTDCPGDNDPLEGEKLTPLVRVVISQDTDCPELLTTVTEHV